MARDKSSGGGLGRGVVGFLIVMELASGLLQGWFIPLIEVIGTRWQVDTSQLNWVTAMYMLMTVVFVPIIGKLGDAYGHKRMLAITAAMVAVGSIVVAIAPSFGVFLLGRALQAPLAAFLPLEFAIVRERQPDQAGRSIGKLIAALTLGAALGGVFSGILYGVVQDLSITLWVPVIFMALCVPVVILLVPETTTRSAGRIDWAGAAFLGLGLLLFLGGVSNGAVVGWTSPVIVGSILGGLTLLGAWYASAKRVAQPLIDLSALSAGGIGLPILMAALFGAQMYGSSTASTFYYLVDPKVYGYGLGFTAAVAGVVLLLPTLFMVVSSFLGDRIARRMGAAQTITVGAVLVTISYCVMLAANGNATVFIAAAAISGIGNGLVVSVLPAVVVKRAPADSVGISSALYNTARTAAGAVAGAVFALIMSLFATSMVVNGTPVGVSSITSFHAVWAAGAALAAVLAILGIVLARQTRALTLAPESLENDSVLVG